jgi:hypothetical protein
MPGRGTSDEYRNQHAGRRRADSGRQRKQAAGVAALALATGRTVREAADTAGVGERTLYRWLRKPAFRKRVNELRGRMVSEAVGTLSKSMGHAARALDKLLRSRDKKVKLAAAKAILELATKLRASEELERRLDELEQLLDGREGGYGA